MFCSCDNLKGRGSSGTVGLVIVITRWSKFFQWIFSNSQVRIRRQEEIEKSWDVPPPVKAVPLPQPQGVVSTPAVPVNGKAKHARKERAGSVASQSSVDDTNAIDAHAVHASLLSALAQKKNANSNNFSRNDFVREVLTLIHTDKDFVDTLWQEYTLSAK